MNDAVIPHAGLAEEWQVLQRDHEQYEKSVLWIRLFATGMAFLSLAIAVDLFLVGVLVLVLWLQEAMARTGQARTGRRLLQVETLLRQSPRADAIAFQLHSTWLAERGGSGALLAEYARHAVRPTVALPYVVLLFVLFAALIMPAA